MPRRKIIAGNWKMNKTVPEGLELAEGVKAAVAGIDTADIVICPPFTALYPLRQVLEGTNVSLGAQGMFWKNSGAYTTQISPSMLVDLGVKYVIVGHSEPRGRFGVPEENAEDAFYQYFGESDHTVNLKVRSAIAHDLTPIICVGETLDERQKGETDMVVRHQVMRSVFGVRPSHVPDLVFAYEPVWAIGTGHVCDAAEANRVCGVIRDEIARFCGVDVDPEAVRIQYGGSMKPDNAVELLSQEHIDGGLIGGASLKAGDFAAIVKAVAE